MTAVTLRSVTSLVEVRIEIITDTGVAVTTVVTSLVEVRIEIICFKLCCSVKHCHFPCGSAD